MLTTRLFPLLLMLSLALLTFWLERTVHDDEAKPQARRHDPDYIVEKFTTTIYNRDGMAESTISAERMLHYPDDDTTVLTAPRFVSLRSKQAPVTITAREGLLSSNGENVYFRDDVTVRRAAHADRSEMVLRTTFLHVIPDENLAKTDRPVTITDAATVVNAVGMELNSETRVLKLNSRVRGTYDPKLDPKKSAR